MAEKLTRQFIAEKAIIREAPVSAAATRVDRSFELPTRLYGATVVLFLG